MPAVAYDKFYYVYRLNPDLLEIEYPKDCDCEEPKTFTDILTGYVSTYGDQEAEEDELIGAESLPTTPRGFGVRWRPEWMSDGRGKDLTAADLRWADLSGADLTGADLRDVNRADRGQLADRAFWSDTTCPDGSMNVGNQPCSEVFLTGCSEVFCA